MWGWVKAYFGPYRPDDLPDVTPDELEAMKKLNSQFVLRERIDGKIALDLMHKDLAKLAVRGRPGYVLTGKGRTVLAAKN